MQPVPHRFDGGEDVIVNQTMVPFQEGDVLNVMMAVENAGVGLGIKAIKTQCRPLIPSTISSMHKIKEETHRYWVSMDGDTKKIWVKG